MALRMHFVAADVHLELRVQIGYLRLRFLVDLDRDPESTAYAIGELVARDLDHARAPNSQRPSNLPDRPNAHGLEGKWNGRNGRAHVADRDGNTGMDAFLALRPRHVGIDDDALRIDVEASAHTAKRFHALLDLLGLTLGHALRKHRLRLGDAQDVTEPFGDQHRWTRMHEEAEARQHTECVSGVLRLLGRSLDIADIEQRVDDRVRRNRVAQWLEWRLPWVDGVTVSLGGGGVVLFFLQPTVASRPRKQAPRMMFFIARRSPLYTAVF